MLSVKADAIISYVIYMLPGGDLDVDRRWLCEDSPAATELLLITFFW